MSFDKSCYPVPALQWREPPFGGRGTRLRRLPLQSRRSPDYFLLPPAGPEPNVIVRKPQVLLLTLAVTAVQAM